MKYRTLMYLFYLSYERKKAFRYAMSHIIAGFSDVIFPNTRVFEIHWSSQLVQNIIVWYRTILSLHRRHMKHYGSASCASPFIRNGNDFLLPLQPCATFLFRSTWLGMIWFPTLLL